MKPAETLIQHALKIGAIELIAEERQLKSGRMSPYFFNSGLFTTGASLNLLGDALSETIVEYWDMLREPTVIFGPAYKGIGLASVAVSSLGLMEHQACQAVQFAHDRKEAKEHGEGGRVVGASLQGQRVVIVDDVITTGGTKDACVELIQEHGGIVTGLVVLFDRQERSDGTASAAQDFAARHKVPVIPIATLTNLIDYIREHSAGSPGSRMVLDAILAYQSEYGIN